MPGYGENSWIGFGEETTWGTPVTRTKFVEILSENIKFVKPLNQRASLRSASRRYYIPGKQSVEGSIRTELLYEGFEKLLKHAMGAGADSALAGGAYLHKYTIAAQPPTGLTIEVNRDVCAFVYAGCQIQSITLENAVDGTVQCSLDILGEDEVTAAASTPTFPADKPVHWAQVTTVTAGSYTVVAESLRLTIAETLAADRYRLGLKTRKGIGRNGRRVVSGSFVAEFEDVTQYNAFLGDTEQAVTITWTGAVIASGNSHALSLPMPRCVLSGDTPAVGGPGVIKQTINFDAYYAPSGSSTGTGPWGIAAQDEATIALVNTVAAT
jgi:Phage tail tube protein